MFYDCNTKFKWKPDGRTTPMEPSDATGATIDGRPNGDYIRPPLRNIYITPTPVSAYDTAPTRQSFVERVRDVRSLMPLARVFWTNSPQRYRPPPDGAGHADTGLVAVFVRERHHD